MRTPAFILALACSGGAASAAPDWRPVPGAPDLDVDVAFVQQQGSVVTTWVRSAGTTGLAARLAGQGGIRPPAQRRQVLLADFDCATRTIRAQAAVGYDAAGRLLASSSVPGPLVPIPGDEDLALAWDAVCELARDRR
ncbi:MULTISPECIES: hypothetical protein [Ramlibacter]|uniref:Uncharacterized protein n=1 Tax=Ramlibacter pinisoli TaxID=2682844 RepID=A0A6N8IRN7_9BURK|nr:MULTISPECIES: hypothetical protein [Ramlibacter]MBA2964426.1 hypothetical protein [Ramlibacter sp. CGMCC 1.13660]MVQ29392.1 hypothetical protein [Ramlibacter pinisoli]